MYKVNPSYNEISWFNKYLNRRLFLTVSARIAVRNVPAAHPELSVSNKTCWGLGVNVCSWSVLVWLLLMHELASLMPAWEST